MKKVLTIFIICCFSFPFFVEARSKKRVQKKRTLSSSFVFKESKQDIELILSKFGEEETIRIHSILRVGNNTYQVQVSASADHCNAFRLRINRDSKTASFLKRPFDCVKIKFEDKS